MIPLFTAVQQETACPKCGAAPEQSCKTPKGHKTQYPHWQRVHAYKEQHTEAELKARHSLEQKSLNQILGL